MPVYNAEEYLETAVFSILNQTYQNFEFLIFNDASEDSSLQLLQSFNDRRIQLFSTTKNSGYLVHLNHGLRAARGKYIVRMDADDEAARTRLYEQVRFMEQHPQIGLAGSWHTIIGAINKLRKVPSYNDQLKVHLINSNPFSHPTVILRKDVIDTHNLSYDERYYTAEDYKLWYEMSKVSEVANIPKVLLTYRLHERNISVTRKQEQEKIRGKVQAEIIRETFPELRNDEQMLFIWFLNRMDFVKGRFSEVEVLLRKVLHTNRYYERKSLSNYFLNLWLHHVKNNNCRTNLRCSDFFNIINVVQKAKVLKNLYWG